MSDVRFEERIKISLRCCGQEMVRIGNLSLRGAGRCKEEPTGAHCTSVGYECKRCYQRVAVNDDWPPPSKRLLVAMEEG